MFLLFLIVHSFFSITMSSPAWSMAPTVSKDRRPKWVEEKKNADEMERRRWHEEKAFGKWLLEKRKKKFLEEKKKRKKEEKTKRKEVEARKEAAERAWMEVAEWDDTGGVGAMSVAEAGVAWDVICGVVDFEL